MKIRINNEYLSCEGVRVFKLTFGSCGYDVTAYYCKDTFWNQRHNKYRDFTFSYYLHDATRKGIEKFLLKYMKEG